MCMFVRSRIVPHELKQNVDDRIDKIKRRSNGRKIKTTQFDITHFCLSENVALVRTTGGIERRHREKDRKSGERRKENTEKRKKKEKGISEINIGSFLKRR